MPTVGQAGVKEKTRGVADLDTGVDKRSAARSTSGVARAGGLLLALAGCAASLAGCATSTPLNQTSLGVPAESLEKENRARFDSLVAFNQAVAKPVAEGVRTVMTPVATQHLTLAARNLDEPRIFANSLLQLRLDSALVSLARFGTNSTIGLVGLFDVAEGGGLKRQTADFGQTLYVWGVEQGDYVVAPILGPTTARDIAGTVVDTALDPVGIATSIIGLPVVSIVISGSRAFGGIDQPSELEDAVSTSIDPYARVKSLWTQNRADQLAAASQSPILKWRGVTPPKAATLVTSVSAPIETAQTEQAQN